MLLVLTAILPLQTFWLLPAFDARALSIVAGNTPEKAYCISAI